MFVQRPSQQELAALFAQMLIANTNLTKVAPGSVNDGISNAIAAIGQAAIKDIALLESGLFPDAASGTNLDLVGNQRGISPRNGALGSSGFVLVFAAPGTVYSVGVQVFSGPSGVDFIPTATTTVGSVGFAYVPVASTVVGEGSNVPAGTITTVAPIPPGHQSCINEFAMVGGRDFEDDQTYRQRQKDFPKLEDRGTLEAIEQAFNRVNPNVLRVIKLGISEVGGPKVGVISCNGAALSSLELADLVNEGQTYLDFCSLRPVGTQLAGIEVVNVDYYPIDVSARVVLKAGVNVDDVRKAAQLRVQRLFDYRGLELGQIVYRSQIEAEIQKTPGITAVLGNGFSPVVDVQVPRYQLPRVRGFRLLSPDGTVLSGSNAFPLAPTSWPNPADFNYQNTLFS